MVGWEKGGGISGFLSASGCIPDGGCLPLALTPAGGGWSVVPHLPLQLFPANQPAQSNPSFEHPDLGAIFPMPYGVTHTPFSCFLFDFFFFLVKSHDCPLGSQSFIYLERTAPCWGKSRVCRAPTPSALVLFCDPVARSAFCLRLGPVSLL